GPPILTSPPFHRQQSTLTALHRSTMELRFAANMHARRLRTRVLVAMGLPSTLLSIACTRPAPRSEQKVPEATPPEPGKTCAIDEAFEIECGFANHTRTHAAPPYDYCPIAGNELGDFTWWSSFAKGIGDPTDSHISFTFDAVESERYAVWSAQQRHRRWDE